MTTPITPITPDGLAELDALLAKPFIGSAELMATRRMAMDLSAALRAAWADIKTAVRFIEDTDCWCDMPGEGLCRRCAGLVAIRSRSATSHGDAS